MEVAFDRIAPSYDQLWTNTAIGQLQRDAVWRCAGPLFKAGDEVLDLGCGTGEDALILARRGVRTVAMDSSSEMVRIARDRGVNARVLRIEDLDELGQRFDGAIANFGALNCVERLSDIREPLGRMIRPGGFLAVCMIGRFCGWETVWYALRGQFRKASRRWNGASSSSMGLTVFYPTVREIRNAFSPEFTLTSVTGIGVCVPPSYVRGLSVGVLEWLGHIDARIARWPGLRALADHRLLIFQRNSGK